MTGSRVLRRSALPCVAAALGMVLLPAAAADEGRISSGRSLYQTHCEICHGQDGQPSMAGAPDFTRGEGLFQSDAAIFDSIRSSDVMMHGFEGMLREEEIIDIIRYVRTLY